MAGVCMRNYEERYMLDSENAPMGIVCHFADGNEEIFHANDYIVRLFECTSAEQFLELTSGSFKNFAYDRDLDEARLEYGLDGSNPLGVDGAYFRIKTRNGRLVMVSAHGKCVLGQNGERPRCYMTISKMTPEVEADWLTGLPSMARFHALARLGAVAIQARGERPAAIALDVMGMKDYNTRYSRSGGDAMLCSLADVLRSHFGSEACSRLAEDHFYAYTSERKAEPTVRAVLRDFRLLDPERYPPVRAGIYVLDDDDDIVEVGFDRAKTACDLDRKTWASHIDWFTDEMRIAVRLRSHVIESIDQAIAENWIRPYYQAIVRSATGDVCDEEALARWNDPVFGTLAPFQFIPDLEEAGMLCKLDLHIVDCVIEDLHAKLAHGVPVVPVSINFSLRDLHDVDLAHEISQRLDAAVLPRSLIRIELTESVASSDPDFLRDQIASMHAHGFEVWMDDFGSGYSSLNTLQEFDFDLIKLDMGFLRSSKTERSRVMLAGVVQAASLLGVGTLTEGVETEEQATYLASIGCEMLQGFYYARPNPLQDIIEHHGRSDDLKREAFQELRYWNDVSLLSFTNLAGHNDPSADWVPMSEFPIAVLEEREGEWSIVRANETYIDFLVTAGVITEGSYTSTSCTPIPHMAFDPEFYVAADRARASGRWERMFGRIEYGTGFQFYIRHVSTTTRANAYMVSAAPTMLGSGLGVYGDVPVAYAVFRVILNDAQDEVIDTEYVYANNLYCDWGGFALEDIIGKSFLKVAPNASTMWFPFCYEAAVLGHNVHQVVFSPEAGHWLSCNIAPSLVEGCCVYAFTIADDEQSERDAMRMDRDTAEFIVRIADIMNAGTDYATAMQGLLDAMAEVIHPDRLYIFERYEHTSSNTFEWCAPGVEPMIDTLQDLDNSEFDTWEELLATDDVVVIPDVDSLAERDPHMHWQLTRQNITHLLAVPFYAQGRLIGYLGADNYMLTDAVDSIRLLKAAASYVSARMSNRRLMDDLERLGLFDQLTGMLSRRGIDQALAAWMEVHEDTPFAVALMDVDEFKSVNDAFGHQAGDELLCELGERVRATFPESAVVGRNGGDEFLAFLGGEDVGLMDSCLARLADTPSHIERDGKAADVRLSAGYAVVPEDVSTLRLAYSKADAALFSVKVAGKGRHRRYDPTMETQMRLQSGFTPRDIIEHVPCAVCCHRPGTGELLLANEGTVRLFECDDLADFMTFTGASFAGIVYPKDRERVREELIAKRDAKADATGGFDVFDFRIVTKAGRVRRVADMGRLASVAGVGEVFYELIVDLDALCGCDGSVASDAADEHEGATR